MCSIDGRAKGKEVSGKCLLTKHWRTIQLCPMSKILLAYTENEQIGIQTDATALLFGVHSFDGTLHEAHRIPFFRDGKTAIIDTAARIGIGKRHRSQLK